MEPVNGDNEINSNTYTYSGILSEIECINKKKNIIFFVFTVKNNHSNIPRAVTIHKSEYTNLTFRLCCPVAGSVECYLDN